MKINKINKSLGKNMFTGSGEYYCEQPIRQQSGESQNSTIIAKVINSYHPIPGWFCLAILECTSQVPSSRLTPCAHPPPPTPLQVHLPGGFSTPSWPGLGRGVGGAENKEPN